MKIENLATAIITIVGLVIFLINWFMESSRPPQRGAPKPGGRGPNRVGPAGRRDPEEEVEAFLRDVEQRNRQRQQETELIGPRRGSSRPAQNRSRSMRGESSGREALGRETPRRSESSQQRRESSQRSAPLSERHLRTTVDRKESDSRIDDHIHEAFDHNIGSFETPDLRESTSTPADIPAPDENLSRDLRSLVSDPLTLKRAFILQTIFQRSPHLDDL